MSLTDVSAYKHLRSMQLHVNIVHFLKLTRAVLKHVPLERWIQLMIGGFKTVNLAWVNKIVMMIYTWFFAYESVRRYKGRMSAVLQPFHLVSQLQSLNIYIYFNTTPRDIFSCGHGHFVLYSLVRLNTPYNHTYAKHSYTTSKNSVAIYATL